MAFLNDTRGFELTLADRIRSAFKAQAERRALRRAYRKTRDELAGLSGRELADLGISRSEITRVAYEATYGA